MGHPPAIDRTLTARVRKHLGGRDRLVLAVSGGLDSMALLDLVARSDRGRIAAVASFDHGTGEFAARAAALVEATAAALDVRFVGGRARGRLPSREAAWRAARWEFLRRVAADLDAEVVTAHTRDDQIETVVLRILRAAGARGLAGLYPGTGIVRPLVDVPRAELDGYARRRHLAWVDDPSNESRAFLRNRVRHDLLPALRRVQPDVDLALLDLGRRAARWRDDLARVVDQLGIEPTANGGVNIAADRLQGYTRQGLEVLGPEIAARAGITLDRRGVERLAAFIFDAARDGVIPLSGGFEVARQRGILRFRRARTGALGRVPIPLRDGLEIGGWRFRQVGGARKSGDQWTAEFPAQAELVVRSWRPGDRMVSPASGVPRRVKRFLRDSKIPGTDRGGWPVVLVGEEIVWIPGVRHGAARSSGGDGRPISYCCERIG